MAKLAILAAVLLVLVALGQASSAFHATITTTVVDEENPRWSRQQRCHEQMRQQQQLSHCQMYLSQRRMGGPDNQNQQQHLRECCQQLQNIEEDCRCQNIMEMVRQRQHGEMRGAEMQEAQNLPSRCNLRPQRCQMRTVSF